MGDRRNAERSGHTGLGWRKKPCIGSLKKLFWGRGFGFIVPDGSHEEVFFHFSDFTNGNPEEISVGMRLRYEGEVDGQSGKTRARNVEIASNRSLAYGRKKTLP